MGRAFPFRSTMNKTTGKPAKPKKQVRISVRGGVAYVDHCPAGVTVRITDYDNREEAPHAHRPA